jgi:hypothetical protein
MNMFRATCPACGKHVWFFLLKREEGKKWHQPAKLLNFCPHCGSEIIETLGHKKWALIFLFLAVPYYIFVLNMGWPEAVMQYRFVLLIPIVAALLLSLRAHKLVAGPRKYPVFRRKWFKNNI